MIDEIEVDGHRWRLRRLDAGDMLDMIEAAGENAGNRVWMRFALVACSVQAVDGVPLPFPRDAAGIKAVARRLGMKGLEAVQAVLEDDDVSDSVELTAAKN